MNNPKRKRRILRSLDLAEVSAVDRPAQAPAGAVLRKRDTMNDQESIIQEALAVHTEGKEPEHSPEVYEAAILAVARLDQHPSENIAQAVARVARDGDPEVTALMFAADRVRDREAASLGKSAPDDNLSAILAEANRVSKGAPTTVTREQAESAMLDLAKREARPGESVAVSFARLCEDDTRMQKLYDLGHAADVAESSAALAKGVSGDARFDRLLMDLARMRKRAGETVEQCASRLLHEDATVRDAYAAVHGG